MKLNSITLAKRYARALFELANEQDILEDVTKDLNGIAKIFKDNPNYIKQLKNPNLPLKVKSSVIVFLKKDANPLVKNFIQMVFDYQRIENINLIVDFFNRLLDQKNNIVHASVTTAIALNKDQKENLINKLVQYLNVDKVILNTKVDQSIIGGVIVKTDTKIIDGSIETKISKIKRILVK